MSVSTTRRALATYGSMRAPTGGWAVAAPWVARPGAGARLPPASRSRSAAETRAAIRQRAARRTPFTLEIPDVAISGLLRHGGASRLWRRIGAVNADRRG